MLDENEEGVGGAAFLTLLNERYAVMSPLEPEVGAPFMESIRKWAEHVKRKVVILSVPVKGSGVASLATMAQGESRPIRAVRWGGRVWWLASQGSIEVSFNTPLPSIVDGTEARQRGFRSWEYRRWGAPRTRTRTSCKICGIRRPVALKSRGARGRTTCWFPARRPLASATCVGH